MINLLFFNFVFWLQRAEKIIQSHNASVPLFLYMAFQNVHEPLQAPKKYTDKYSFIEDRARRTYAGMVDSMDEAIGNITEAMKEAGYGNLRNAKGSMKGTLMSCHVAKQDFLRMIDRQYITSKRSCP